MPLVTTESGQARIRLIQMFREAQQLARTERECARAARSLIRRVMADSAVREQGDVVHLVMPRQTWDALRHSTGDQT
jgi:Holliday junction resolvasome RuvABC ATP-dependent DNA helicase subunit